MSQTLVSRSRVRRMTDGRSGVSSCACNDTAGDGLEVAKGVPLALQCQIKADLHPVGPGVAKTSPVT